MTRMRSVSRQRRRVKADKLLAVRDKAVGFFFFVRANIRVRLEEEMKRLSVVSVPLMPLHVLLQGSKKSSVREISVFSQIQPLISITEYESVFFFSAVATRELQDKPGCRRLCSCAKC